MNVGVDLGRSSVKISYPSNLLHFPSIIAKGCEGIDEKQYTVNTIDIEIDKTRYWVGKHANRAYISFNPFDKNHVNEYTKIFLLSALSLLDDEVFNVVIGLPLADFTTQKKDLITMLRGEYLVKCAGKEKRIVVKNIVVFPQCIGGLLSQYLSYSGNLIKEIPPLVGCVDIGYKDVGFCLLRDGEPDLGASWSIPEGLHSAFIAALPEINKEYDYELHEINPEIVPQKYYNELKQKILNQINQFWPKQKFPVYCCGGGSYWIKIGEQIDNPVFTNAIGFRKMANMKWP